MVAPRKWKFKAKNKENENYRFRAYLKMNAEPDELDARFRELHQELFAGYDCGRCRNCCKEYGGRIPVEEVSDDAKYLGMSREEFIDKYLESEPGEGGYKTRNEPCDFLEGNICILGDRKPAACKEFPYTDKEDRISSLMGIIGNTAVCPVVYEMVERLKAMYGFRQGL